MNLTSTNKDPAGYLFSLVDANGDKQIDDAEWEKWAEACGDLSELLDFETALSGGKDEEEEEEKDAPTTLDSKTFASWLASLEAEDAKQIYELGTRAAKIVSIQAMKEFEECPRSVIAKALDLKMGSTTG